MEVVKYVNIIYSVQLVKIVTVALYVNIIYKVQRVKYADHNDI